MPLMKLEDQPVLTPVEGYRARMVHSESMTLAYWEVDAEETSAAVAKST